MARQAENEEHAFRSLESLPERRSLGKDVYLRLRQAILRGELAPGSRLVESRLADALGISRTPVREGIHKLERENLVRQGPSGGFFVAGLTREDVRETFGIRSVLESYAARLAAVKHEKKDLVLLDRKIREYQTCVDRGDLDPLLRINTEFHDHLYALSRSPRLIKMINDLRDQIYRFRQVLLRSEEWARVSNNDHRLMLTFIRKRDEEGVERLVREHILRGQGVVLKDLERSAPPGSPG
ncbi:MAG: GntR family transcriptional regulator [Deltaproteobacteria bacterium]|nr:GntR family transcriptional regulator [Deltaproteobacteria bacterium]